MPNSDDSKPEYTLCNIYNKEAANWWINQLKSKYINCNLVDNSTDEYTNYDIVVSEEDEHIAKKAWREIEIIEEGSSNIPMNRDNKELCPFCHTDNIRVDRESYFRKNPITKSLSQLVEILTLGTWTMIQYFFFHEKIGFCYECFRKWKTQK